MLRGREEQQAATGVLRGRAGEGASAGLVLRGEPGTGKTNQRYFGLAQPAVVSGA
jgi:hypothetical protein